MLALLTLTIATAPLDLAERFVVDGAGAFAVSQDGLYVAKGASLEHRSLLNGRITETTALPCAPIDVVAEHDDDATVGGIKRGVAWGALCSDRVLVQRPGEPLVVVLLEAQSAPPAKLALRPSQDTFAVAWADGYVRRGRLDARGTTGSGGDAIDLRGAPVAIAISGVDDVTIDLADGTRHVWTRDVSEVNDVQRAAPVELYDDDSGAHRARVDAPPNGVVCARRDGGLACYGAAIVPPEIPRRDDVAHDDDKHYDEHEHRAGAGEEFEAPLDFGTPGAIAAMVSAALGLGEFASAPFVMQALSPSLGLLGVVLAGLGAVAGTASFAVVAGVVVIVAAVIIVAIPDDDSHNGDWGACAPLANAFEGAIDDCVCAIATIVAVVAAAVAAAGVGVALLSVAAMQPVDQSLGGGAPASDPFLPALAGATAGGVVGWGVGTGISLLTMPLRDDDEDGEADNDLDFALDTAQVLVHVAGGSAVGAAIGYGVARGR